MMEFYSPVYKRFYEDFELKGVKLSFYNLISEKQLTEWMDSYKYKSG